MGSVISDRAERDDDLDDHDSDTLFDEGDDIFSEDEDDEDQEGVFRDKTSIFSSPHSKPEDHHNPLISKEQERQQWETPKPHRALPGPATIEQAERAKKQLVAKFDQNGQPFVARHVNGKAVEQWRRPTQKEHEALRTRGRLVKGGIGAATASAMVVPPPPPGTDWKKVAMWAGGLAAAGYGSWWLWNKYRKMTRATSEEA